MATVESYPAERGPSPDTGSGKKAADQKLIEKINARWTYYQRAWKDIWDEQEKDERAMSTIGPWTDKEIRERENKRPCIHMDQLGQHVAALVNNARANPIAIKVEPEGSDSDDKTAELRSKRIRAIEYNSKAVSAYHTALECAAESSIGVVGVTIDYKSWDSLEREIKIRRFANQHAVMWDPDCREIDYSDMRDAFVLYRMSKDEFRQHYGDKVELGGFGGDHQISDWEDDDSVQVAEYWYVENKKRRMIWIRGQAGNPVRHFADDLEDGWKIGKDGMFTYREDPESARYEVLDDRKTMQPIVKMCITNGRRILDRTDWPGKEIPIIPLIGKEKYIREANRVRREFLSYIRKGRDPQKLYDYYAATEAEIVGMSPKIPYIGYKGQFKEEYWATLHKIPRAYAEVELAVDPKSKQLLPLPQRQAYEPPVQALEIGKESTKRAIYEAVASYGTVKLTEADVKSGVAIEKLQAQTDMGSYHFINAYKTMVERVGRICNDLLDDVDGEKESIAIRNEDETQEIVKLGVEDKQGNIPQLRLTDESQHNVTVGVGPNFKSQRDEGSKFVDTMVSNLANLPVAPAQALKLVAKLVKLKSLGPIGDQIVDILDPEQDSPEAQLQEAMQEIQKITQIAEQLGQKIQQLEFEKAAQMAKAQSDKEIALIKANTDKEIAALKAEVEQVKIQAGLMSKHEELSSKENIEAEKAQFAKESAEAQAAIDRTSSEASRTKQE